MQTTRLAAGAAAGLVVIAGLSGCGGDNKDDHAAHATSTTKTTTAPTTTRANLTGTSIAPLPPPSPTHPPARPGADVIAFASDAGRPGCTEAVNVVADYLGTPRTGDAAAVDGWTCAPTERLRSSASRPSSA